MLTHTTQFTIYLSGVVGSYEHGVDVLSHKNSVIYIDTELKFDPNRLVQIALERYPEIYSSEFRSDSAHQVDRLLTAVKVRISHLYHMIPHHTEAATISDSSSFTLPSHGGYAIDR